MSATTDPRLEYLFERYFEGTCTPEEKDELLDLVGRAQHDDRLKCLMDEVWTRVSPAYRLNEEQSERILSGILPSLPQRTGTARITRMRIRRWSAAAAALLALFAAGWVWHKSDTKKGSGITPVIAQSDNNSNMAPGGNKAVLILGNGTSVVLDSARNGIIARQGGMPVIKLNGRLSYSEQVDKHAVAVYNTIVTPRGGQYQVVLPDGSKVWLNAASSLRFPTVFTGKERSVALTGEAYFEIAKNKEMPFRVNVNGMEVKVLGTHFNIMAYDDEPVIRTTLLEGSVQVSRGRKKVVLRPGQQASVSHSDNRNIQVDAADVQAAVAWKNGLFLFHDTDLRSVLRQIARWYDAEVTYSGDVNAHLNGMISRKADLSQVFHMLEVTSNVKFKIEGRKIIVTAKS